MSLGIGSGSVGLALGGGFARAISHIGVLRVFEEERIPLGAISGVSAGAIVGAAYASGTPLDQIEELARAMRFRDLARWTLNRLGLVSSERMNAFLTRILASQKFEDMR